MGRKILIFINNLFMRIFFRVRIIGGENIPESGPGIIAINHMGRLDVPLVFTSVKRDDFTGWVAEKYQKVPLIPWMVRMIDGIWIDRFNVDMGALRQAQKFLKSGGLLAIAPEGTRSPMRTMIQGKQGVAYLAAITGVPIIPGGIDIPKNSGYKALLLMRPIIYLILGKPFTLPPLARETREQALKEGTEEIMCRIAALLPEKYWGIYNQKPRLVEMLSQKG